MCNFQTVGALHMKTEYAHLNITSNSILLLDQPKQAWDDIRLTDFEFAQCDQYSGQCATMKLATSKRAVVQLLQSAGPCSRNHV